MQFFTRITLLSLKKLINLAKHFVLIFKIKYMTLIIIKYVSIKIYFRKIFYLTYNRKKNTVSEAI